MANTPYMGKDFCLSETSYIFTHVLRRICYCLRYSMFWNRNWHSVAALMWASCSVDCSNLAPLRVTLVTISTGEVCAS